jgi:hypothetical protein
MGQFSNSICQTITKSFELTSYIRPGLVVELCLKTSASYDSEKNRLHGISRPIQQLVIPYKTSILGRSVQRRIEINFITKWSLHLCGLEKHCRIMHSRANAERWNKVKKKRLAGANRKDTSYKTELRLIAIMPYSV